MLRNQSDNAVGILRSPAGQALAGGHTTGSVTVFVKLPADRRYAFIGDLAWQLEDVREPAERPLLMRKLADVNPGQVRQDLLRVASLAGLMQVVPAHDVSGYDGIPRLPAPSAASPAPGPASGGH
jgi:N-acyl homoserine lactone hydrolase